MSWAKHAREALARGESVTIRPKGNSMEGKVSSGDAVTLEPVGTRKLKKGDVVLARVRKRDYLHQVLAIQGARYLIGNNRGGVNGWTRGCNVFGIAVKIE